MYLYHRDTGSLNHSRSPCIAWLWQRPKTLLERSGFGANLSWSHRRAEPRTSPRLPHQQHSCRDNRASFQPGLALLTSLGRRGMCLCTNTTDHDRSSELFLPCLALRQESNLGIIMRLSHASAPFSPCSLY